MRKYLEMEAELGSDNEDNDDVAKFINRDGDEEENEDGQDEDLKDFVVYEGDDQEIEDESADLYEKYRRDMDMQDRENIQKTMEAVLFGQNNKKRKRYQAGLEDMDDPMSRRKKLMEERMK
jgi:hypothetical protein